MTFIEAKKISTKKTWSNIKVGDQVYCFHTCRFATVKSVALPSGERVTATVETVDYGTENTFYVRLYDTDFVLI